LTHVEAAVLAVDPDSAAARRIRDALAACVERVEVRSGGFTLDSVCAALASCKAAALLVASDELGDLTPRAALALIAGMPARGGPELVAFERGASADLRLALINASALDRIRAQRDLRGLDALLVPIEWL
jgi:hypothetical protein